MDERGTTRPCPFSATFSDRERFFFYNLFSSDRTGAPLSWRNRPAGSVDAYAAAVGRWLVTRDAFDFLVFYLSDYDYASHEHGPDTALVALQRSDGAIGSLIEAGGGIDPFLEKYAVIVLADHGQTHVREAVALSESFAGLDGVLSLASNRAGHVYLQPGSRLDARAIAVELDGVPAAAIALFREGSDAVARRDGEELRFAPALCGEFETSGDSSILDHPDALSRAWAALSNPNAGEVIVSAAEGYEFTDLGGGSHIGGGSHGSLAAGDSIVPLLTIGVGASSLAPTPSIVDVAPLVLAHFGVEAPGYAVDRAA